MSNYIHIITNKSITFIKLKKIVTHRYNAQQ